MSQERLPALPHPFESSEMPTLGVTNLEPLYYVGGYMAI